MLSPLQIARLTATIANQGQVLQPYVVDLVRTPEGHAALRGQAGNLGRAIRPETAAAVAGMMEQVVERGTGRSAALSRYAVAGKTGSAQLKTGEPHAWFTCFAPAARPRVVVTVVIEHGGAGSEAAAPIARRVLSALLERSQS
jgi:peptidoglycan glycosyltransferase